MRDTLGRYGPKAGSQPVREERWRRRKQAMGTGRREAAAGNGLRNERSRGNQSPKGDMRPAKDVGC